jgi:hypothetical protein
MSLEKKASSTNYNSRKEKSCISAFVERRRYSHPFLFLILISFFKICDKVK